MTARYLARIVPALCVALAISACSREDSSTFMTSAQSYLAKSDYPAAIIQLKNALNLSPNNAQARFLLAKALLDSGSASAAETEARKAMELKHPADDVLPVLVWALVRQGQYKKAISEAASITLQAPQARAEVGAAVGMALHSLGQTKDARAAIAAAIAVESTNTNARISEVRLTALEKDLPGALRLVDAVIAASPNNLDALVLKADVELALHQRESAVATLDKVIAIAPNFLPARYSLATNLVVAKKIDRAVEQLEVVKKQAPNDPRTLYLEALVAFARGNGNVAYDAVRKSVQVAPDYLPARYLAGIIEYQRGSYAAAEDSLRRVLAKAPDDDGARRVLAATYLQRGQASRALDTIEPALGRSPRDPGLLKLVAETHFALNQPVKAADYYERANALGSNDISGRVRLAQVRLASGDAGQGLKELEALTASDPTKREPALALISAHLKRREFDKAMAAAKAFVKSQPESALAHNTLGVVSMANRDTKNARLAFEKALALDANFVAATYYLAVLDIRERNLESARKRYEQALVKDPKAVQALLGLAQILVLTNAPQADIDKALRRAIAANPETAAPRMTLIRFYSTNKDWKAALAAAREANTVIPGSPEILEALGVVEQASGEPNQAIETFRRLAKLQPDNPSPLIRIADVQGRSKDYTSAIGSLRSALAIAPETSGVWLALAAMYAETGQIDAGLVEARKFEKDRPASATGYALEGELLARQGKLPQAAMAFRTSLAKQQVPMPAVRLHGVLVGMGKQEEAAALVRKWVKDHPNDVTVRAYLGQQSLAKSDYKTAVPLLSAALENDPDNVLILNNLAWAMAESGNAGALEHAEHAYRLAPSSPEIINTYGWVLVQRGDTARGIELLRKAVNLAPTDPRKRLQLARGLMKAGDKAAAKVELEAVISAGSSTTARSQAEQLLKDL